MQQGREEASETQQHSELKHGDLLINLYTGQSLSTLGTEHQEPRVYSPGGRSRGFQRNLMSPEEKTSCSGIGVGVGEGGPLL